MKHPARLRSGWLSRIKQVPKRRPKNSPLIPVRLTQVTTSDGIDLAGVVVEPRGRKRAALIWLHGLTSSFDSGQSLLHLLSQACIKQGIGYFKFNTRGHHIATRSKRGYLGAGFEKFIDSPKDIHAMIGLAGRMGYRKIILAGHSTGANKALYYLSRTRDRRVKALLLAGPGNDIVAELTRSGMTKQNLRQRVDEAKRAIKKHTHGILPTTYGLFYAQRFVSLFDSASPENVFPYDRPDSRWTALGRIRIPIAVMFGQHDQYVDRPTKTLVELFKSKAKQARQFTGMVVPGADHGFKKRQLSVVLHISRWLRTVV